MSKMRILHVSSSPLHIGGVEYQITALSEVMSKKHEIHLAADGSSEFYKNYIQTGGVYHEWKVETKFDVGAIASFNKIINSIKPDIIHIHDPRAGWLLRPLLFQKRIPVVYTTHLPPYFYIWSDKFSKVRQFLYGKTEQVLNRFFTSAIIYVSKSAYDHALDMHYVSSAKAHLILNGINLEPYRALPIDEARQLRSQFDVPPRTPILCVVARLSAEKNFPFFLRAISQLHGEGYTFVVWIIGEGSEHGFLNQLAGQLGIESFVKFWGSQTNIPLFLSSGNIFALTSLYEGGRTISIMEAQAAGKPCVVSAVGDHNALIENGVTGFIFEQGDQNAFVRSLKLLLDSPDLMNSFGESARRKAFNEYDIEIAANKHEQLYASVLAEMGEY